MFLAQPQKRAKNECGSIRDRDEEEERMSPTHVQNLFRPTRAALGVGDLFFFLCAFFTTMV